MRPKVTATMARPLLLSIPLLVFAACSREELPLGSGDLSVQNGSANAQAPGTSGTFGTPSSTTCDAGTGPVVSPPFPPPPIVPPTPPVFPPTPPPPPPGPAPSPGPIATGPAVLCGSQMACAAGTTCCTSTCGGFNGEPLERRGSCASSCGLSPGIQVSCNPCTVDADCQLVDNSCTDPVSSCQCRAHAKGQPPPAFCTRCDPQACSNKVVFCMIAANAPVPPPIPGAPPAPPPKPQGVCVMRDAPAGTFP